MKTVASRCLVLVLAGLIWMLGTRAASAQVSPQVRYMVGFECTSVPVSGASHHAMKVELGLSDGEEKSFPLEGMPNAALSAKAYAIGPDTVGIVLRPVLPPGSQYQELSSPRLIIGKGTTPDPYVFTIGPAQVIVRAISLKVATAAAPGAHGSKAFPDPKGPPAEAPKKEAGKECKHCHGTGVCQACHGHPVVDCGACNGTGNCNKCGGSGYCAVCNGNGCSFCKHSGYCIYCKGKGICGYCKGSGVAHKCSVCNGSGACYYCGGKGTL